MTMPFHLTVTPNAFLPGPSLGVAASLRMQTADRHLHHEHTLSDEFDFGRAASPWAALIPSMTPTDPNNRVDHWLTTPDWLAVTEGGHREPLLPRGAFPFSSSRAKPRDLSLPDHPSPALASSPTVISSEAEGPLASAVPTTPSSAPTLSNEIVILSNAKNLSRVGPTTRFSAQRPRLKPWATTPDSQHGFQDGKHVWRGTRCGEEILRQAQDDNVWDGAYGFGTGLWSTASNGQLCADSRLLTADCSSPTARSSACCVLPAACSGGAAC